MSTWPKRLAQKGVACALGCTILVFSSQGARADESVTVFWGADVFTAQSRVVDASWFVVKGGRVVDVGKGDGIPPAWAGAPSVDLRGKFVAPGFVDAHVHFVDGGLTFLQADLGDVHTRDELDESLRLAARAPLAGWVMARGLGLEPFGGVLPTHVSLDLGVLDERPVFVALKGGHHVYVNRAGEKRLGLHRGTPNPSGGELLRDADSGELTGILVNQAAWSAVRAIYEDMPPEIVARATLEAQRRALAYGITSIGDNTFFPDHMKQYQRLADDGKLRVRISSRSFGDVPITKFLMQGIGRNFFGNEAPGVRYFGEKFFVDGSLSLGAADVNENVRYPRGELEDIFLFAGSSGLAFHSQTREGAERLIGARTRVRKRRSAGVVDVIDHCGRCDGDLPRRIKEAGFSVTLLPGQLHDLATIASGRSEDEASHLLNLRAVVEAQVEPALTSDWPYGMETTYPDVPGGSPRLAFAPLSLMAVAVTGKGPMGEALAHVEGKTIPLADALLGYTARGARAIGRADDLGAIARGHRADFVILPRSPFEGDPVGIYGLAVDATYIDGDQVYRRGDSNVGILRDDPRQTATSYRGAPFGTTWSPVLGYDPVPGFIVGGALFFYPYRPRGALGSIIVMATPEQQTARIEAETTFVHAIGALSPRISGRLDTWQSWYFGFGNDTPAVDGRFLTRPFRVDTSVGALAEIGPNASLGAHVLYTGLDERSTAEIVRRGGVTDDSGGAHFAGVRFEVASDSRDNAFSTRRGGKRVLWSESWLLQGGHAKVVQRFGASVSQFIPIYAPWVILGSRMEVGANVGQSTYVTHFALGGSDMLRGFLGNRFRGDAMAVVGTELRFPIWSFVSGAVFGEVGRVWPGGRDLFASLHPAAGGGLRFGLPPDQLIKLRFDGALGPDQWGIFFKFGEAF